METAHTRWPVVGSRRSGSASGWCSEFDRRRIEGLFKCIEWNWNHHIILGETSTSSIFIRLFNTRDQRVQFVTKSGEQTRKPNDIPLDEADIGLSSKFATWSACFQLQYLQTPTDSFVIQVNYAFSRAHFASFELLTKNSSVSFWSLPVSLHSQKNWSISEFRNRLSHCFYRCE